MTQFLLSRVWMGVLIAQMIGLPLQGKEVSRDVLSDGDQSEVSGVIDGLRKGGFRFNVAKNEDLSSDALMGEMLKGNLTEFSLETPSSEDGDGLSLSAKSKGDLTKGLAIFLTVAERSDPKTVLSRGTYRLDPGVNVADGKRLLHQTLKRMAREIAQKRQALSATLFKKTNHLLAKWIGISDVKAAEGTTAYYEAMGNNLELTTMLSISVGLMVVGAIISVVASVVQGNKALQGATKVWMNIGMVALFSGIIGSVVEIDEQGQKKWKALPEEEKARRGKAAFERLGGHL